MKRTPIPHSKTFTGCWTCRARHVKCDEERPECRRCRNRNVACEGYGFRLVWNDGDEKNSSRPSLSGLQNIPTSILCPQELAAAIQNIDDALPESTHGLQNDPFSVFRTNPRKDPCFGRTKPSDQQHTPLIPEAADPATYNDIENFSHNTSLTTMEVEDTIQTLENDTLDNASNVGALSSTSSTQVGVLTQSPPPFLNPIVLPSQDRVLMHHWIIFVSTNCVLLERPDNAFRTVFTPLAVHHSRTNATAQNALYHALCAGAAYSRAQVCQTQIQDLAAATRHEYLAVRNLQESIASSTVDQKEAVLATVIMLAVTEVIRGTASTWRQHIVGGKGLIDAIGAQEWEKDLSSSVLYQQMQCGAAVAALQSSEPNGCSSFSTALGSHYCLDTTYGLSLQMFNLLIRLKHICQAAEELTVEETEAFELELYLSAPSAAAFPTDRYGPSSRLVYLHMAHVFYYAMLIHFKRRVRRDRPQDLQDLVCKCIEHLEAMEDISKGAVGGPITWACLVPACEADSSALKERFLVWCLQKRRHGFGVLEVAMKVAAEVWRRRETQPTEDVHWMDIMDEMGWDVLLC